MKILKVISNIVMVVFVAPFIVCAAIVACALWWLFVSMLLCAFIGHDFPKPENIYGHRTEAVYVHCKRWGCDANGFWY